MQKLLGLFIIAVLFFFASGVKGINAQELPTPTPIPSNPNSFELFWPIAAGKVQGDFLYPLKNLKENLREALIFGSFIKAEFNITLSEKRTVEADKLLLSKSFENAGKTLKAAQSKREKAISLIEKAAQEGKNVKDLKNRLKVSLEKQRALLKYLALQIAEGKDIIDENVSQLEKVLANLQ